MSLNKSEIERIAHLARIKLSNTEIEKISTDLNRILGYVDQIKQVDTTGIDAMTSVYDLDTVFREDEPGESLSQEDALSNAPDKNSDYFKVPKVLPSL
jgi:aspartyl-tRNA(Asn)/glutamyl-tRNA(Gln) amidotransferase subunit C